MQGMDYFHTYPENTEYSIQSEGSLCGGPSMILYRLTCVLWTHFELKGISMALLNPFSTS